jgi:hypothetical protein
MRERLLERSLKTFVKKLRIGLEIANWTAMKIFVPEKRILSCFRGSVKLSQQRFVFSNLVGRYIVSVTQQLIAFPVGLHTVYGPNGITNVKPHFQARSAGIFKVIASEMYHH